MDDLTLAQKLVGKEESEEEKIEQTKNSGASITYMIAVTASSNGEVVLKNEVEDSQEWEDGTYAEVDEDGEFEELEEDEDEEAGDGVLDATDGDGENIDGTNEAAAYTVLEYHNEAVALLTEENEASEDEIPGEDAEISAETDDGDAEDLPDVGTIEEDEPPGENDETMELTDEEYTLADPNSDDESDVPSEAEASDGYTIAECIGAVKQGDRVAVMVQDGKLVVLGVVGSGDEQEARMQDNAGAAEDAAKTATNYIAFKEGEGLCIGDMTGESLGRNVLITAECIYLRNGTTVLAAYKDDEVDLGKGNRESVIDLCDGMGKISNKTEIENWEEYNRMQIQAGDSIDLKSKYESNRELIYSDDVYAKETLRSAKIEWVDKMVSINPEYNLELANALYKITAAMGWGVIKYIAKSKSTDEEAGIEMYGSGGKARLRGTKEVELEVGQESFHPYITKGMNFQITLTTSGYVTSSGTNIYFVIPIAKQIIGDPTITISSVNGLKIRQNGKYTHGSSNDAWVKPTTYVGYNRANMCIGVRATMEATTNAENNAPCGVDASVVVTLS